jgi:putative ABC transport system permease protein
LAARWLIRETRGWGFRLVFFVACLAVGVAAVVAVAALSEGVRSAVRGQARELLAADLVVRGRQPAPPAVQELLAATAGLELSGIKEMASMAAVPTAKGDPGASTLVQLKAVEPGYPFHGRLLTEPALPLFDLLDAGSALAAPELLTRLELEPGDGVLVGGQRFRIAGVLLDEPDRAFGGFGLGPRLLVTQEGLARTPLEGYGSRITHRTLVRMAGENAQDLDALAEDLRTALGGSEIHEVETWRQGSPALQDGLVNAERFLGLVALLSLLVGGLGVARTIQAWLATRLRDIAVLKCLGVRPREVVGLHLVQVAFLALVGSAVGVVFGLALASAAPVLLAELLPVESVVVLQPAAVAEGLGLGIGVALLFALAPLLELRRLPPARVLRADAAPPPPSRLARLATGLVVVAGLAVLATAQSGSVLLGAGFAAGLVLAALLLAGAARLIVRAVGALPREGLGFGLRHGLASLARPSAGTTSALVALGLGVLAVLAMALVERELRAQLLSSLPTDAPTAFFLDVQPDQWDEVQAAVAASGADAPDSVPMVMARLAVIDGRPVDQVIEGMERDDERRWVFTREQRLTWREGLPPDNLLVAGELWGEEGVAEVSVERDYAADLGVGIGSMLTLDVQGVPMDLRVTSLREVNWRSFNINFFFVVEPGVLDDAPHSRLAAARLEPEQLQGVQDRLARSTPNVAVVRVQEVLDRVSAILQLIGYGVRALGTFTVLAGLAILAGVVSAGAARRGREVALLKTLGATRAQVVAALAAEQALVGLVAGAIGSVAAAVLAWFVLTEGMNLEGGWPLLSVAAATGATALLAMVAGVLASLGALRRRPAEILRRH